jgi:quinol-cytochrome oxidoreductase complex cytochrome b subunit
MPYLDQHKDWKYHIKSLAVTFGSAFLAIFAGLVMLIDIPTSPDDITFSAIGAIGITVARLSAISAMLALQQLLSRFKK